MKNIFFGCRKSEPDDNCGSGIKEVLLIVLAGIILGVLSKLVDSISLNEAFGWHRVLELLDLRNVLSRLPIWALLALSIAVFSKGPLRASMNVFGFFIGMLIGYYGVTMSISGFFPKGYIVSWGIITLFTPVAAYFAWYSRGSGWMAVILSSAIIGFFITDAFSFEMWYIGISYYDGVICLLLSVILLYKEKKQLLFSLTGALIAAPLIQTILPYIFGGL